MRLQELMESARYGVYRKSKAQIDTDGPHTAAASAKVKRGGKHVTFSNEKKAKEWIDANGGDEQLFVRKVSKQVKESVEVFEGTWADPLHSVEDAKKLIMALRKPIPAQYSSEILYDIVGDDDLWDLIDEFIEDGEVDADVRPLVIDKVKEWLRGGEGMWMQRWNKDAVNLLKKHLY